MKVVINGIEYESVPTSYKKRKEVVESMLNLACEKILTKKDASLPFFKTSLDICKGMEADKKYALEELGL